MQFWLYPVILQDLPFFFRGQTGELMDGDHQSASFRFARMCLICAFHLPRMQCCFLVMISAREDQCQRLSCGLPYYELVLLPHVLHSRGTDLTFRKKLPVPKLALIWKLGKKSWLLILLTSFSLLRIYYWFALMVKKNEYFWWWPIYFVPNVIVPC